MAGLAVGATMIAIPIAHADPMDTNCESNMLGALYCDGPVQPDGSWNRCVDVGSQAITGQYGQVSGWTAPMHQCYHYDPAAPPFKLGQPDHHIGLDP
ncbi:CDGP domain-containing protein [Mycobacterium marseillense]|uniref:CDGP domain-containing protein n=2 Tax=Mycobacterium marseillense TaxID=701042 RepID=A0AAC9VTL0_9MYCO|nr:hypothetical protein [Mycobacterium marseillense]ASW89727.1 hypothetical protein CKJ54_07380 [Mycobacterium marseillense]